MERQNPAPEPSALKAAAVNACLKVHERAASITRESRWTRAYITGRSPAEAAEIDAREYDATHWAAWIKRGRR